MHFSHSNSTAGVIFDLDGVISDTQVLHSEVESSILAKLGVQIAPEAITSRFAGVGDRQMFSTIFEENKIVDCAVDQTCVEKWRMMSERLSDKNLKPVPHALELIKLLKNDGFVLSIASGSPRKFIKQVMDAFAIGNYFSCFVSGEEVPKGKPAPDVFLEAAARMKIAPINCVVIEDGLSGMQAAASAGMGCIGLVHGPASDYPASVLVTSLEQVTANMVAELLPPNNFFPSDELCAPLAEGG